MLVYNYHPITLEYTGCSEADPDPLDEGRWLIPACASTIAPPEAVSGKNLGFHEWDMGVRGYLRITHSRD